MIKALLLSVLSIIIFSLIVNADSLQYSGVVKNDIGRPAAYATVTVESLADPGNPVSVVTDTTGTFSFELTPTRITEDQPINLKLYGNYPNPFNPQTRISYSIDKPTEVRFEIFNVLGQEVPKSGIFIAFVVHAKSNNGLTNQAFQALRTR